jgi:hypothetical protein
MMDPTIRKITVTLKQPEGPPLVLEGENALAWIEGQRPYQGSPSLDTVPCARPDYRVKNPAGGRKVPWQQAKSFKGGGHVTAWPDRSMSHFILEGSDAQRRDE